MSSSARLWRFIDVDGVKNPLKGVKPSLLDALTGFHVEQRREEHVGAKAVNDDFGGVKGIKERRWEIRRLSRVVNMDELSFVNIVACVQVEADLWVGTGRVIVNPPTRICCVIDWQSVCHR